MRASEAVNAWVRDSKARMIAVRNTAIEDMVEAMQTPVAQGGALPVRTGYLRNSFVAAPGAVELKVTHRSGPTLAGVAALDAGKLTWDGGALGVALASMEPDGSITLGWVANYARRMEYGFHGTDAAGRTYNQSGRAFARLGIPRWPQFVEQAAQRLYNEKGGGR